MKKKVALINPRKGWRPAMGLLYVASHIRHAGYDVRVFEFIDESFFPGKNAELWKKLHGFSPEYIGLGVISWNRRVAREIIQQSRNLFAGVIIFCGGKDPTFKPEVYFSFGADYVIHGEGEKSSVSLLESLENEGDLAKVPGLYFKTEGSSPTKTSQSEPLDVDELLFPAFELVDYDHYCDIRLGGIPGHFIKTGFLIANRGCPYRCRFCTDPIRNSYRERKIGDIIKEILWQIENWDIDGLVLLDDLFYHNDKRVAEFCEKILENNIRLKLYAQTRVDRVGSKETLALMAKAGFVQLALGVESGSQRMLDIMNKGTKLAQIKQAIGDIKKAGIMTYAFMIIGFPEESREDLELTVDFLHEIQPTFTAVNYFMPMPGTQYYNEEDEKALEELSYSLTEDQREFRSPVPKEEIISFRNKFLRAAERSANRNMLRYPSFYFWLLSLIIFHPTVLLRGIYIQRKYKTYTSYFEAIRTSMINHRIYRC